MCEPVTLTALTVGAVAGGTAATVGGATALAAIGIGALAAGATASAMGAYNQSKAAKQQANYQAQVARNNATMAEYAAQDAANRGAEEAAKIAANARRVRSRQVATIAGSGIDITSDSSQSLLEDTDFLSAQDATQVRNNAARAAWGFRVEGQNFNSSSAMYRTAARNENPLMAAGTSLLGSAAQFGGAFAASALSSPSAGATQAPARAGA